MGKLNSSLFSSKYQKWETPQDLFDMLNREFKFELDVCAVHDTAKCEKYFTPEIDGLSQKWKGYCWMNPPYGREQVKWITKANEEVTANFATTVCLIPARPDTKVWQDIIFPNSKAICFIKGRLKFGGSKNPAPFPSALVLFGNDITENQKLCFKELGTLVNIS
ncbi:DNA N-6-adenine-methyltransferase [Romboutsia ilealis]|uniref:DNA N-6-adenine-methyltransferase n=1 Tax=Romboutsia ilealis TaxID=1115758 RepID=UPI0026F3E335|nr:DNA N-6-adenine-methyltransferase [Romboutsia ilealis]